MDDGSASVRESVQLLQLLKKQGVKTVAATPHFYAVQDTPEEFLARRAESWETLCCERPCLSVLLGAEVAYFEGMSTCQELTAMQIGNSGLLLVEMPFTPWSDRIVNEVCSLPERLGVTAVLAHVDRYLRRDQMRKYAEKLISGGVYMQCNASIFAHSFRRRWILRQLAAGNISFLGTDCHNMGSRKPDMEQALQVIGKALGPAFLADMDANAKEILGLDE